MTFIPHDYQTFAVNHILKNAEAALLLDMGLGRQDCDYADRH